VKKNTAANYAVKIGDEAGNYNRLMDTGSGESLLSELAQLTKRQGEASGLLYVPELSTFVNKQEYNVNLVQLLTDLFDSSSRKVRKTKARGDEVLENIAVSCIFGTNEEWLSEAIPPSALGGGLMSRILTWHQEDTDREFPRPVLADEDEYKYLVGELTKTQFIKGSAWTNKEADKWYDAWYLGRKDRRPTNERLGPFWQRMPDHLLRLGMLLSVSEDTDQRDGVEIKKHHLTQGEAVLNWILKNLPRVYAYVDVTGYGKETQKIISFLRHRGGKVSQGELGRKMSSRMSSRQLEDHLETLKKHKIIEAIRLNPWEGTYGWRLVRREEEM